MRNSINSNSTILTRLRSFPRIRVAHLPTPIEEMSNLTRVLNAPKLYVKRDDCTGLAFGGNKVRQLEYYFGEAHRHKADTILITGSIQSNYARMAAAMAKRQGLNCHIQLENRVHGIDDLYRTSGNVLLDRLLGAVLHTFPYGEDEEGADLALEAIADDLRQHGARPYVIHLGPTHSPLGALGYVDAAREFLEQLDGMGYIIDEIVVASGSAATHVGLLCGLRALGSTIRVTGVCVRRKASYQRKRIAHILQGVEQLLSTSCPVKEEDINLFDGTLAPGYGQLNRATREALVLSAQTEAILLDPVYSGKALAGLIALVRQKQFNSNSNILFWHTGGLPALFAYGDKIFED